MDLEKIYNKLEKIDDKLDIHIKEMEGRISTLEERVAGARSQIKMLMSAMLAVFTGAISYIYKSWINPA